MKPRMLEPLVHALLYEGYILYPYRPSSAKNRCERFTFGRVYPETYSHAEQGVEPCLMQTECLVRTNSPEAAIQVNVRFLQPQARDVFQLDEPWMDKSVAPRMHLVPELRAGDELVQTWHEALERCVEIPANRLARSIAGPQRIEFHFEENKSDEPITQAEEVVGIVRRRQAPIAGSVELITQELTSSLFKLTVRILNQTPVPPEETGAEAILLRTFSSTHTILQVRGGEFVSLLDPGQEHAQQAKSCRNIGTWPVLVGDETNGDRDTLLSSPIILYDYPQIAQESAGPLFDGTEIDEILSLRILTMTESEKNEMRQVDEHARRLLERTEALDEAGFWKMHGVIRKPEETTTPVEFDDFFGAATKLEGVTIGGNFVRTGDRVRVQPKGRADLLDLALAGRIAVVEAVEQDLEGRIHLAVVFEDDPGKDLGILRQPGHRFFYGAEEVEPLVEGVP